MMGGLARICDREVLSIWLQIKRDSLDSAALSAKKPNSACNYLIKHRYKLCMLFARRYNGHQNDPTADTQLHRAETIHKHQSHASECVCVCMCPISITIKTRTCYYTMYSVLPHNVYTLS